MVSIITPVHNAESFIERCMASVYNQTYGNWEHLLIDDASTDKGGEIITELANRDPRVIYVRLKENVGPGNSRNKGIEMAKGRYIAFLDSDDSWYPNKLELQLKFMQDNGYPFTYTAYDKMYEDGSPAGGIVKALPRMTYKKALYKNRIGCLTVIYDTHYFGKQFMPSIRKRQDYALWLKLLKKADAYGMNRPLSSYRLRTHSVSSNKLKLFKYEWQIYRKEEQLPFPKALFYMLSAIVLKLKSYF